MEVYEQATFKGLGYDNNGNVGIPPTLLDWNPSGALWDFAIGIRFDYQDGIPASAGKQVQRVELLAHTYRQDLCYEMNRDYPGNDIQSGPVADAQDCQRWCMRTDTCTDWSYQASSSNCWLKTSAGAGAALAGMTSGPKYCGAPVYERQPACGFPDSAPAGTHLVPPLGLFCPFQTVTYTCDIGGINEIKDEPGR